MTQTFNPQEPSSINAFPSLRGRDSRQSEGGIPPRSEYQPGGIHIAIMRRAATRAIPASHSKTCDTFRASEAPALGTGLGSPSLVNFDTYGLPSGSFVPQHISETRPASIEHGLGHPRLGQAGGVHVAHSDQTIFTSYLSGLLVEVVSPCVGDFSMDGASSLFVASPLRLGEPKLLPAEMLQRRYFRAVAACGQGFEAKVYADLPGADWEVIFNLTLEGDVPAAPRILNEGPRSKLAFDRSRFPETKSLLEVDRNIPVSLHRARGERHPAKRSFTAEAGSELWAAAMLVSGLRELPAYNRGRVRVDAKVCSASRREPSEIKRCGPMIGSPTFAPALSLALSGNVKVPYLVTRNSQPVEMLPDTSVLDAVFQRNNTQSGPDCLFRLPLVHPVIGASKSPALHKEGIFDA